VLGQSVQTLSRENRISLPWDTMKQVVFSILLGLDYLHSVKGVLHGGEVYYVVPFFLLLFSLSYIVMVCRTVKSSSFIHFYELSRSQTGQHSFGFA
jgi:hypothetical protein